MYVVLDATDADGYGMPSSEDLHGTLAAVLYGEGKNPSAFNAMFH